MRQIVVNPSDTIQVLTSHTEAHEGVGQVISNLFSVCQWNETATTQAIIFTICLLIGFFVMKNSSTRKHIIRHLMHYACIIFFIGLILYVIGFNWEGSQRNLIALFFRAATASMEMFVSESELIEVVDTAKEDPWYMAIFATTHFLAMCISAAFILHIIGIRFWSYVKMCLTFRTKKDVFVFFDLSKESINLAKDIHKKRKGKFQIIFVKTPMEENHLERFSFSHILSFADNRNETIEELIGLNAYLTYSRKRVVIGMDENEWKQTVGLDNLHRYIKHSSGEKFFFCMSPNEDNNVSTAVALSKRYQDERLHHIYCRANHDSITESLGNLNLKFIDSASLAVLELKKKVEYQPVSFVKPDTKRCVATKPFKSMIIGFGETGFEVFKFLHEFSAFVGNNGRENPSFCNIIDPKAKQLENSLYMYCPALKPQPESKADNGKSCRSIKFHEGTIESNQELVIGLIKELDYIVVCTDSEKDNLSIGISLLNLAYKYRETSDNLSIFIGINDNNEYKKAQEIAKFYNSCGKRDNSGHLYEFTLIPFGARERLFTYENIIDDKVLEEAKSFYYEYQRTAGLLDVNYKSERAENKDVEWNKRRVEKVTTGKAGLYNKNELLQKEFQDMANVWHIQTKLHLVGACNQHTTVTVSKCPAEIRREELFKCIDFVMRRLIAKVEDARKKKEDFKDSYSYIINQIAEYEKEHDIYDNEYQILFENLAECEHLRWVAANEVLGYRPYENAKDNKKHYLSKKHACMVSNEELLANEELRNTIKYDYNTILVSMNATKIN